MKLIWFGTCYKIVPHRWRKCQQQHYFILSASFPLLNIHLVHHLSSCILGSSWIPRNSWPAWHQGTQSECVLCPLTISRKNRWLLVCVLIIGFLAMHCLSVLSFRVIQVSMVQRERLELLVLR